LRLSCGQRLRGGPAGAGGGGTSELLEEAMAFNEERFK